MTDWVSICFQKLTHFQKVPHTEWTLTDFRSISSIRLISRVINYDFSLPK